MRCREESDFRSSDIYDYAPSSVVSTVSSSWEDGELEYDLQATALVQNLFDGLEACLYSDASFKHPTSTELIQECQEWASLFPCIRATGHACFPNVDPGYELLSRKEVECRSPYFGMPEHSQTAGTRHEHHMHAQHNVNHLQVVGIGLSNGAISRRRIPTVLPSINNNKNTNFEELQSLFDWSDAKTQRSLRALSQNATTTTWHLFRYTTFVRPKETDPTEEEDRCPTPTPDNPTPVTQPADLDRAFVGCIKIEVVADGTGGIDAMQQRMQSTREFAESPGFALFTYQDRCDHVRGKSPQHRLGFISWASEKSELACDVHGVYSSSREHIINACDILMALPDIEIDVFEGPELPWVHLLSASSDSLLESMHLAGRGGSAVVTQNSEEIYADNGEVVEYLALSQKPGMECEAIERQERRRAAIPPVSPKESVRQDIVRHLVEDLWLELVPTIRPLVDALPPTETLASNAAYQESRLHELRFGSESDGDSDDDLLSAMTIKPVYLQKRDSSARHRSSHDLMALAAANLVPEFYAFSRPASSRPTSARVPALRAASGRPTSGRNPEVSGYAGYHTNTSRMQGSTVSKSGPAWKRSTATRLMPLPSGIPVPTQAATVNMHDTIYGTSFGAGQSRPGPPSHVWDHSRPSTAATRDNAASKRLPPIRSSLFNSSDFSEAKTSRHVVFETREPQELQQQRPRATSPRPFSARRQPSAGIRRARPQTAMIADDSRHYVTLGNSSSVGSRHLGPTSKHVDERGNVESTALAPLMGTRMPRQGVKSAVGNRRKVV